jgi:hypothetical protein
MGARRASLHALGRTAATALVALALAPATGAEAAGAEAAGGGGTRFWDLLTVGQGETVNAFELAPYLATGEPPASFESQRELFEALLYEAPDVRTSELDLRGHRPSLVRPARLHRRRRRRDAPHPLAGPGHLPAGRRDPLTRLPP